MQQSASDEHGSYCAEHVALTVACSFTSLIGPARRPSIGAVNAVATMAARKMTMMRDIVMQGVLNRWLGNPACRALFQKRSGQQLFRKRCETSTTATDTDDTTIHTSGSLRHARPDTAPGHRRGHRGVPRSK